MTQNADVIIIGTGVIGSATAFELAKRGYKTLSVDHNRQIGHGSTAGSCAIIRMHYSTFDGTAFASLSRTLTAYITPSSQSNVCQLSRTNRRKQ